MFKDWFYKIILASVWLFLLQPSGALAVTDTHIECYTSGDFGGDTDAYDKYKVPINVNVIGIDSILAMHQAACNAVRTVTEQGSTWSDPLIRIVYMLAGQQHRRNLRPNQCMFIVGLRYCARLTIPIEGKNVHGNTTGLEGGGMKPQLCAYVDPMDGGDTIANEGRYHHNTDISTFYDSLPDWAKVLAGPIGGLVGGITSVKNHVVVTNLGCVDRPMAEGPPAWKNDAWKAQYFPPPTINYANDSTFASPTIRLDFCRQAIVGVPSANVERVVCQFEKDLALGEYKRDATGNLILLPGIEYEGLPVYLTPTGTATNFADNVVTASGISPDGRKFEARISVEVPDSVCVYKTEETLPTRPVDILEGCLPRPGYMPVPIVTDISTGTVPMPDTTLEGAGILGIKLGVSFPDLPGQIELEYLGDQYVGAGAPPPAPQPPPLPAGAAVGDPINSCKTLHQVTFCAKPGPVDITDNGDGTFKAKGSLCVEGYSTAPLVAAGRNYKVETLTFGHDGKVIYDPPLPNPQALPVFKNAYASDVIKSKDTDNNGTPDVFPLPVNTFVPALTSFTNVTANRELAGGVVSTPVVTLKVGSYHYEPPMSNLSSPLEPGVATYTGLNPAQQRPINQSDPYFVGGAIDYDYNGDGNRDGYDDAKILRPMTPLELGLCAEIQFDIVYTQTPPVAPTPQTFPSAAGIAAVNWETDTHVNETFISNTRDCSKLKVKVWGAGGGGSSNVGGANDFTGGGGGYIEADYDLLALNLVNAPIPVSVGIGGAFTYIDPDVQEGQQGSDSSFGISTARIVAGGGGGHASRGAGGSAGTCSSLACTVVRTDAGQGGSNTAYQNTLNVCLGGDTLGTGGGVPDGSGGYTLPIEGSTQCEGINDNHEARLFRDPALLSNPGSAVGQYHHRKNLKFGEPEPTPTRTFGAGGCSSEKGCNTQVPIPPFLPGNPRNGNVAPGAHGRVEAVCTQVQQIIPPTPTPTGPSTFP